MAFCPNCGSETSGRFCPNCGTDMAGSGAGAAGPSPGGWSAPPPPPDFAAPGLRDNVASTLCYLGGIITGVIFLLIKPYSSNRLIRFHAWQSIFLSLAALIVDWALDILIFQVLRMGFVGSGLLGLVHLFWFVVWIYMMISAYNGKRVKLPVIGEFAENQAGRVRY